MRRHRSFASLVALATSVFALAASAQTNDKPAQHAAAPDKSADTGSKPDAKQAGDSNDDAAKPDEKKPDEKKAGEAKPDEKKAGEAKPDEKKAGEAKPDEKKAGEAKPGGKDNGETNAGGTQPASGAAPANTAGAPGTNAAAPGANAAAPGANAAAPGANAAAPGTNAAAPGTNAAAPPPGAAPSQPAPAVAATGQGSTSPTADQGAGAGAKKPKHPPERTFGIEIDAGTNARLDGATEGYTNHEAVDLTYGGGLWFAPSRLYSLGISFQRAGIGSETSPPTGNSVAVTRDLNTLWLGGRAYPLRGDSAGLYIRLNLGASWQHVNASGTTLTGQYVATAHPFACSASQGPGFAIGAGVGGDVDLDSHLAFIADAGFGAHRMSSDASDLGGCAPGSGSVTNLAARIGFMYRFDLGGSSSKAAASSRPALVRF